MKGTSRIRKSTLTLLPIAIFSFAVSVFAQAPQATPPPPSAPRTVQFPKPVEKTLPNGLRVVVVQRSQTPLISAQLLIKSGGEVDPSDLAGVGDMTAALLTRGTTTRSATQIAEAIEALGGFINSGARWDSSAIGVDVMSSRIGPAMEILADVVRNPAFKDEEIDRLRRQYLNSLKVALGTPGSIARFVAARVVYRDAPYGHPLSGTPESLPHIKRDDVVRLHDTYYRPDNAILVIGGDIRPMDAFALAERVFADWQKADSSKGTIRRGYVSHGEIRMEETDVREAYDRVRQGAKVPVRVQREPGKQRVVVIDKPDAGQAAVLVVGAGINRKDPNYFRGIVANSVLSGYSGRLNWEIRVKRGLSYGAGSVLDMRRSAGSFNASAQTKNESGAEVASLTLMEISKLATGDLPDSELTPRKASLIGGFARGLETTGGLVGQVSSLAIYGVSFDQMNQFVGSVQAVKAEDVKSFAATHLNIDSASVIVVGDAKKFLPALQKMFTQVEVIPVGELDLNSASLRRPKP